MKVVIYITIFWDRWGSKTVLVCTPSVQKKKDKPWVSMFNV